MTAHLEKEHFITDGYPVDAVFSKAWLCFNRSLAKNIIIYNFEHPLMERISLVLSDNLLAILIPVQFVSYIKEIREHSLIPTAAPPINI